MASKLIGRKVIITDRDSFYFNEWGIIKMVDEDGYYHIAIANGSDTLPIFERKEFRVVKEK